MTRWRLITRSKNQRNESHHTHLPFSSEIVALVGTLSLPDLTVLHEIGTSAARKSASEVKPKAIKRTW